MHIYEYVFECLFVLDKRTWIFLVVFSHVHLFFVAMTNQELINAGNKTMDETDQAIERSKMVNI